MIQRSEDTWEHNWSKLDITRNNKTEEAKLNITHTGQETVIATPNVTFINRHDRQHTGNSQGGHNVSSQESLRELT